MKILVKDNNQFGGYIGFLANDNNTITELPTPLNISATQYTNKNIDKIIELCKRDAKKIFDIDNLNVEII